MTKLIISFVFDESDCEYLDEQLGYPDYNQINFENPENWDEIAEYIKKQQI